MKELEPVPEEVADAIEKSRKLTRKLGGMLELQRVEAPDVLIGMTYGLHDLAAHIWGDPVAAIEWQRTVLDQIERSHLEGQYAPGGDDEPGDG